MDMRKEFSGGALSDEDIQQLIVERFVKTGPLKNVDKNVRPSSLDMHVDMKNLWEVPHSFVPSKTKSSIQEMLVSFGAKKVGTAGTNILHVGKTYVVPIVEQLRFRQTRGLFGKFNPKSSTGRADIGVQTLADFVPAYDTLPEKFERGLYAMLTPSSFSAEITEQYTSFNQMRLFQDSRRIVRDDELRNLVASGLLQNQAKKVKLIYSDVIRESTKVELSLDLKDLGDIVGYVSKRNVKKNLIWLPGQNDKDDFFEPIYRSQVKDGMIFEKGRFYILSTREGVCVPAEYACEMIPYDETLGDFRSHFAGFIDNGWGLNGHRPLTLELRANRNMYAYHGQPIAYLTFDKMHTPVIRHYDAMGDSNYSQQSDARLGKFFHKAA